MGVKPDSIPVISDDSQIWSDEEGEYFAREPRSPPLSQQEESQEDMALDLLTESVQGFCNPVPFPPDRLDKVRYFGRRLAELHSEHKFVYECKHCDTPIILSEELSPDDWFPAPGHGDVIAGHCIICLETSTRSRRKAADYPRKFCSCCAAWVDSTHWSRHLDSKRHEVCGPGTDRFRTVDWDQSRYWKRNRTEDSTASFEVEPSHVYWAADSVELEVMVQNVDADLAEARLVIEVASASPGFTVAKVARHHHGNRLQMAGFNAEYAIFNGIEPATETVRGTVKLEVPKGKPIPGTLWFYKKPKTQTETLKEQLRNLRARTLDAQRGWISVLPDGEDIEAVALECGFKLLAHELVMRRLEPVVREVVRAQFAKNRVLEFLGADFSQPRIWAAWKLGRFSRAVLRAKAAAKIHKAVRPRLAAFCLFKAESLTGLLIRAKLPARVPWNRAVALVVLDACRRRSRDDRAIIIIFERIAAVHPVLAAKLAKKRNKGGLLVPSVLHSPAALCELVDACREDVVEAGGVARLRDALRDRNSVPEAAKCLASLAWHKELKTPIGDQCIPLLCRIASSEDDAVVALRNLCYHDRQNQDLVVEALDIEVLTEKIDLRRCQLLLNLMGSGDTKPQINRRAIAVLGTRAVFSALGAALETDYRDVAAHAFARLAWDDANKEQMLRFLPDICKAKTPHVALLLRNVAYAHPSAVVDSGALDALALLLKASNPQVLTWAAQATAHLTVDLALRAQVAAALAPSLVPCVSADARLLRDQAATALKNLAHDAQARTTVAAALDISTSTSHTFFRSSWTSSKKLQAKICAALDDRLERAAT